MEGDFASLELNEFVTESVLKIIVSSAIFNRVSFSPDGIRNGPKLAGYSTQQDKEASKGKAFMLGSENDAG